MRLAVCYCFMIASCSEAVLAAAPMAPTFQELMDPAWFPHAQRGMAVEAVEEDTAGVLIRTTGAEIRVQYTSGDIQFKQRIGHERTLAVVHLGRPLEGISITHRGPGLAWMSFEHPKISLRINGDSLCMLHVHESLSVSVESKIDTAWQASYKSNHLIADEWGAFGLYTSMGDVNDQYDPYAGTVAVYPLAADAVLWVASCPPKAYDWERSFRDNVVWHWSNVAGYPDDAALTRWKDAGNIVLLQSEVMLWKDWNLDFVPRLGVEEFSRVRETLHGLGMRFMVYTSPYYFLRGTSLEPAAFNSFEGFTNWPPGTPTGENMGLFLDAIQRVMTEHKPDGLYFDGQYIENPAALYALARSARRSVGETGLLEWHSTHALGHEGCYLPPADAYVDFTLRGEGQDRVYGDTDYLRFFVSGYNINNCIGVLCNNGAAVPTPELASRVLEVNARFHTIAGWLDRPDIMDVLRDDYQARLGPAYRDEVEARFEARQQETAARAAARRAEFVTLNGPPAWATPVFALQFSTLPETDAFVSPANPDPFAIDNDTLQITARAHTHAFYRFQYEHPTSGFVVKLKQGSDAGMSWGPAVALRWPDGSMIRAGVRSDGLLQADILGRQLLDKGHVPDTWVWLRARWGHTCGVLESSSDGEQYTRVWTFEHGGLFNHPPSELLVGKIPYNGEAADHAEPGPEGVSYIAYIETYTVSERAGVE
ncbi:MAG: hypothetical protein BWX80_00239 [Candidatus Hydrogenedentes bacterium ADurb.Bin101]|nr:MAG: hypothetical protein BWX80_00239 [Candidatus Hydrogenedentes bacterium ADurb.Bin101]